MEPNEALETLAGYARAFVNNVLYGNDVHHAIKHIDDAEESLRAEIVRTEAVTVGTYEI